MNGSNGDALAAFDRALELQPDLAEAHAGRGRVLAVMGRVADALVAYERAARLNPRDGSVFLASGYLLAQLGRRENALAAFSAAADLMPSDIAAMQCRTMLLTALHRHVQALPGLAVLDAVVPRIDYVQGAKLHSQLHCCDWSELDAAGPSITERVRRGERADVPFTFMAYSGSPRDQRLCAQIYVRDRCLIGSTVRRLPRPSAKRPRVAYLSADFRVHPVAQQLAGVFESHDRSRIETYAIALCQSDGSRLRSRLERSFEHFFDWSELRDADIAERMAELSIDIAVDLGGHTLGAHTQVLAYRPAPIQVAFLGFPGTSGADFIDYIVADRHVIPEAASVHYTERVIYLPETYFPSDLPTALRRTASHPISSRLDAGLPASGAVFCCFNAPYKILPPLFDIWMRILTNVAGSVLWLRDISAGAKANLAMQARCRGVAPERLVYATHLPTLAAHYDRLSVADVFLDTHPYNAHTTACDALAAGVPVVTMRGDSFASRVATSLLHAVGLGHLSVETPAEYERLATRIGGTPDEAAALKAYLHGVRVTAPLFDTARFCRHLESAYREIWARQERGEAPSAVRVGPHA